MDVIAVLMQLRELAPKITLSVVPGEYVVVEIPVASKKQLEAIASLISMLFPDAEIEVAGYRLKICSAAVYDTITWLLYSLMRSSFEKNRITIYYCSPAVEKTLCSIYSRLGVDVELVRSCVV